MSKITKRGFSPDELVLVGIDPSKRVVLNSGGPLMKLETTEGGRGVCSWEDEDGKHFDVFPIACLSRLVPLEA